jgi:hypothetical protein
VDDYLGRLDQWLHQHRDSLDTSGQVTYLTAPQDDRDKKSAHLVISRGTQELELLLWESGEAEFNHGPLANGTFEHHDLKSTAELDELLARLLSL